MNKDDIYLKQGLNKHYTPTERSRTNITEAQALGFQAPDPQVGRGLTQIEVEQRLKHGLSNKPIDNTEKKVWHIITKNTFSLFNLLHVLIAAALLYVNSYENILFLGVVFFNTLIGIVQELQAKRMLDKLSLSNIQLELVIRDGGFQTVSSFELVQDDIMVLRAGSPVAADCIIKYGQVEVNEAMITGESDCIIKTRGDTLLSGSFITSDVCYAQIINVGAKNYINQVTKDAKKYKKYSSEMIDAIRLIIKLLSAVIVPLGGLLFWRQISINNHDMMLAVERTSAAILSMIPEGLVLLTSVSLAVGATKLAKNYVLIQELYGLETLSKIDIVCMDKTGTITENNIQVHNIKLIDESYSLKAISQLLAGLVHTLNDTSNQTFCALKKYVEANYVPLSSDFYKASHSIKFSSSRKWSGAEFENAGAFALGAPEILLKSNYHKHKDLVEEMISDGNRVVALVCVPYGFHESEIVGEVTPIALIALHDTIRENSRIIVSQLQDRGACIKLLSGDNPLTVSHIAQKIGVENYDNYIDATTLTTKEKLRSAALQYTVFGRLSPNQKQQLVKFLKEGHKVAMIGDGVNDVLALKESDCSIALKDSSYAAKQVSQIVLMKNDLGLLSNIILEGQRIINNIQRSGTMFLSKTLFAIILTIILLFWRQNYPFTPIQLTLINSFTVGIPSFILSFQSSREMVQGKFLTNIISRALPSAFMMVLDIILIYIISGFTELSSAEISTLCVLSVALTNLLLLRHISFPINKWRKVLIWASGGTFATSMFLFHELMDFQYSSKIMLIFGLISCITYWAFGRLNRLATRLSSELK